MKQVFAASYSTLCSAALSNYIAAEYGLQNVQCTFMVRGVGDTYIVDSDNSKYVLRVYRHGFRTLPQIQAEAELLTILHSNNVSVSYPITGLSGNSIHSFQAVEGIRYAILFTYAPGNTAIILTPGQLASLGHEMAKFHNVSSTITLSGARWDYTVQTTLTLPLDALKDAFTGNKDDYEWLLNSATMVTQKLAGIDTTAFSMGYCQFDFLPKNFHFDGDKVTLFDFDFLGYGWLVNDVMTFWVHLCLDVQLSGRLSQAEADKAFATFIQAYRQHRILSNKELSIITWLSLGFWVYYMGFHATHDQFYPLLQPANLKLRAGLIKKLYTAYCNEETAQKLLEM